MSLFMVICFITLSMFTGTVATASDNESDNYHNHATEVDIISEMSEGKILLEQKINELKNSEKLYGLDEILDLPSSQFINASDEEVEQIKSMIKSTLSQFDSASKEKYLERKIPLSLVYIDNSEEESDAVLTGGGLPYCLDDNGWGPANFITSDCDRAMLVVFECIYESIIKKPEWRYCRADLNRNCSPQIGHSPYWHTH